MKDKHLKTRIAQCDLIASNSPCCRRKVGALVIDPESNVVISEGYNGTPRGSDLHLCGGVVCLREINEVKSGTQNDIGCIHAEQNAIYNAARIGTSTKGKWLLTNCDPCLMCAKAILQAGVTRVYLPLDEQVHIEGVNFLKANNVLLTSTKDLT
jgi:dCMP deaminase